jgi:hypothetical protein
MRCVSTRLLNNIDAPLLLLAIFFGPLFLERHFLRDEFSGTHVDLRTLSFGQSGDDVV